MQPFDFKLNCTNPGEINSSSGAHKCVKNAIWLNSTSLKRDFSMRVAQSLPPLAMVRPLQPQLLIWFNFLWLWFVHYDTHYPTLFLEDTKRGRPVSDIFTGLKLQLCNSNSKQFWLLERIAFLCLLVWAIWIYGNKLLGAVEFSEIRTVHPKKLNTESKFNFSKVYLCHEFPNNRW